MEPRVPTTAGHPIAPPSVFGVTQPNEGSALGKGYSPEIREKALQKYEKKKIQHFFSKLSAKFEAASTQPPSSLHSRALTESLFLTLLHRQNPLLSSIYFHFYLKGREELGFYVQQTRTGLFLQCIRLRSAFTDGNAYLNFHKNTHFCPADLSRAYI